MWVNAMTCIHNLLLLHVSYSSWLRCGAKLYSSYFHPEDVSTRHDMRKPTERTRKVKACLDSIEDCSGITKETC